MNSSISLQRNTLPIRRTFEHGSLRNVTQFRGSRSQVSHRDSEHALPQKSNRLRPVLKDVLLRGVLPYGLAVATFKLLTALSVSQGIALPIGILTWVAGGIFGFSEKTRSLFGISPPTQRSSSVLRVILGSILYLISGGEALRTTLNPSGYVVRSDEYAAFSDDMPYPASTSWKLNREAAGKCVAPEDLNKILDTGDLPFELDLGDVGKVKYLIAGQPTNDPAKKIWLMHGVPKHSSCLRPIIEHFVSEGFTVYCWDMFGIGQSTAGKNSPKTLAGEAQIDALVAQALGVTDAHVVGHSWFAIRFGEMLDRFGDRLNFRSINALNATRWPIASTRTQPVDGMEEFLLGQAPLYGRYGMVGLRVGFVAGAPGDLEQMVYQTAQDPVRLQAFVDRYLKPDRDHADWGGVFLHPEKASQQATNWLNSLAPNHFAQRYYDGKAKGRDLLQRTPLFFLYADHDVVMVADGMDCVAYAEDTWSAIGNTNPLSEKVRVTAGHFSYVDDTAAVMNPLVAHIRAVNRSLK